MSWSSRTRWGELAAFYTRREFRQRTVDGSLQESRRPLSRHVVVMMVPEGANDAQSVFDLSRKQDLVLRTSLMNSTRYDLRRPIPLFRNRPSLPSSAKDELQRVVINGERWGSSTHATFNKTYPRILSSTKAQGGVPGSPGGREEWSTWARSASTSGSRDSDQGRSKEWADLFKSSASERDA